MQPEFPDEEVSDQQSLKQMAENLVAQAKEIASQNGLAGDNFNEIFEVSISKTVPKFARQLYDEIKRTWPDAATRRRKYNDGFRTRILQRWQPAFDLLEAEWTISQEAGSEFFRDERGKAVNEDDHVFEALVNLHSRALLVAKEALCLLEGGFPDGAMSRWRTLHEFNVTAHFLLKHGNKTAHLYLSNAYFEALRHAKQAQSYSQDDPSIKIAPEIIKALEQKCAELKRTLELDSNIDLSKDYAWSASTLNIKRPTLYDIEQDTGRDFWRPRYRWASQHIHGGHSGSKGLLGMAEADRNVAMLVGPSNGGLVDPIQMVAHSLADITDALLSSRPDMVRRATSAVLWILVKDIGPMAMQCQEEFRQKHRDGLGK